MRNILTITIIILSLYSCKNTKEDSHTGNNKSSENVKSKSIADIKTGLAIKQNLNVPLTCNGRIEIPPSDFISVHSKTDGYISFIKYLPGQYVKKGSVLVRVENPKLIGKQRIYLETKADLNLAEKELARKTRLKSQQATSSREYDQTLSKRNRLKATFLGLKSELQNIGIGTKSLSNGAYQKSVAIIAETGGYISNVDVNKGQYITAETLIMQIANNGHLHLELKVYDSDASKIKIGQNVIFNINSSSKDYKAEIVHINPILDEKDGSLNIHCHFDDKEKLKAGMYVQASITTENNQQKTLPMDGVVKEGKEYYGYRIEENGVPHKVLLTQVSLNNYFITSKEIKEYLGEWVVAGAYYADEVEGGHSH